MKKLFRLDIGWGALGGLCIVSAESRTKHTSKPQEEALCNYGNRYVRAANLVEDPRGVNGMDVLSADLFSFLSENAFNCITC